MKITLSFLGKDSVPFHRDLDVPEDIYNELKKLTENKSKNDEIFDKAGSAEVSGFLNEAYKGISPKVLRTAKCNQVLVEELKKQNVTKDSSEAEKIKALYKANLAIAKTLNHQKNVAKNQKEQEKKLKEKVSDRKDRLQILKEKQVQQLEKIKNDKRKAKVALAKKPELLKERLALLKEKEKKLSERIEKANAQIAKAKFNYEKKKETADINLGTSLGAYADFRIIYSWCNDMKLDPRKIYNKGLFERSQWAVDTPASFWKSI